jgi:hypothetical protein
MQETRNFFATENSCVYYVHGIFIRGEGSSGFRQKILRRVYRGFENVGVRVHLFHVL